MSKLNLDKLKVQSFVTTFNKIKKDTLKLKGGSVIGTLDEPRCAPAPHTRGDDPEAGCGSQTWPGHPADCQLC